MFLIAAEINFTNDIEPSYSEVTLFITGEEFNSISDRAC